MIAVDMQARFVPAHLESVTLTPEERRAATVRGHIVYVNYGHKYFTVEYERNGITYKESFNFVDCGKTVHVRG